MQVQVAHLPWRQMTYKFLNTIVDDFGAFIIKAPFLYRLAVFRDDVVFLIYVYQRWIYRVDPSRANEFGFSAQAPTDGSADGAGAAVEGTAAAPALQAGAGSEKGQPEAEEPAGTSSAATGRRQQAQAQVRRPVGSDSVRCCCLMVVCLARHSLCCSPPQSNTPCLFLSILCVLPSVRTTQFVLSLQLVLRLLAVRNAYFLCVVHASQACVSISG